AFTHPWHFSKHLATRSVYDALPFAKLHGKTMIVKLPTLIIRSVFSIAFPTSIVITFFIRGVGYTLEFRKTVISVLLVDLKRRKCLITVRVALRCIRRSLLLL
ncbi:hypothetical protein C0991_012587, partial [Blastosporella zonata]